MEEEKKFGETVPERGFMLDISRGRVPATSELFALADLLANLRYNRLQLYVEHTFAFENHEEVWRDASPLTAREIRELDAYCRSRGIELVPNLNSFGHVERWLKHPRYRELAECPDGFFHEIFKMRRAAGTFAAGEKSADFMGELYREFLPNFSSEYFNIGGDEPWELGLGRSRELCREKGKRAVYVEQMMRLKKRAEACGKKIMFWGDVLLGEKGALPKDFLRDAVPVIWGYEAGHPFAEQCSRVRAALPPERNGDFCLAPGTSAWLSFTGRQINALENISEACRAATDSGAKGILLTTWGDFGYHNPFAANLVPLIFAALKMRNFRGNAELAVREELVRHFSPLEKSAAGTLAQTLIDAGKLDRFFRKKITNRSVIRELFFAKDENFSAVADGIFPEEIAAANAEIFRLSNALAEISDAIFAGEKRSRAALVFEELRCALKMSGAALARLDGNARAAAETEIAGTLKEEFARVWLLRNREGGLAESLAYF